jgi:excisionase family DNA binding protein
MAALCTEPSAQEPRLNLKQVAARLGVHYMTAYRYLRQGRLAAIRVGTAWEVPETAVQAFEAGRRGEAALPPGAGRSEPVDWASRLTGCLLAGDEPSAWGLVEAALGSGHPVGFCYVEMLSAALASIGAGWEAGELTVADQHVATAVASRLVARLGALARRPGRSRGTVVFGAPSGERHSLPVSIAADLVRLAGFNVLELGADVPAEAFALAARRAPRLVAVGIGVARDDCLPAAQRTIDAVRELDATVPVIIGGQAAISAAGACLTGVTAWAASGPGAVALVESLAERRHPGSAPGRQVSAPGWQASAGPPGVL